MEKMLDNDRLVKVMCVDPKGVWAMVRRADYPQSMPYVVRVKELSQPTMRAADASPAPITDEMLDDAREAKTPTWDERR